MINISQQIAQELTVNPAQVQAAINLLDDGATVPFIARYRKEATQGLDDNHLRHLEQRLTYLRELQERRDLILKNIKEQGKLTAQLQSAIEQADNKTSLEDLYLPYRPKRRTKGQIAIEAGLEPLADALFNDWNLDPDAEAEKYITSDANFPTTKEVLDGSVYILMERFSEDAPLIQKLRRHLLKQAHISAKVVGENVQGAHKYKDYFQFSEKLSSIPSHRALAMLRGRNEGILQLSLNVDPHAESSELSESSAEQIIRDHYQLHVNQQLGAAWINRVVRLTWKVKLGLSLETELISSMREAAELEAIDVFAKNLKALLMAAPGGPKVTMGIDPGIRTGCKIATVDATGKLLHTTTIFPHEPQKHWQKSIRTLSHLINEHKVELVAIGNGTASRETDTLVAEALAELSGTKPAKLIVSEAGASVYSASETAANEFPDLDVSLRGAVSIARRLQDPLAELVKIEPKAIGVGQYQHDVSQSQLSKSLDAVVEDCVNAVGVDANSASMPLLSRVAGLSRTMAQNIVAYRDQHGAFQNRQQLLKVARLGPKAFEQAAGFIRINHGDNPLDASGVHPESYALVNLMAQESGMAVEKLIGEQQSIKQLTAENFVNETFGLPTIKDILSELEKPGRDPRGEFKTAKFKEGVNKLTDLAENLILEGVVSNVTKFGAFVDIGVHQDGLVHISSLTDKFVSDPHEVVKAGDIVKVKVLDVDVKRKRISLTMRLDENASSAKPEQKRPQKAASKPAQRKPRDKGREQQPANSMMGNAFAEAFAKAKK
ncbi:RNA-binding transcriptional accessory protein [Thalassotalea litorea]|uniref:RNA-binding transcriptional accessory protein n=1 Tax=Thalassotalea litorea TaxID=2020715 RepID=A0A5R9IV30_9GAMM|nr:Tex family protein [Thalassotalea litorea]TLU65808.1 RNA-binding transcriptional accessory protein [Thalassotalea litorea]